MMSMKLLSVDNYICFKCIGEDCPISCCGGNWGIPIDDESYEYYMSLEGEFGERLKESVIRVENTNMFRLDDKTGDCIFLDENKLCSIYRTLGKDALCFTCRSYPRALYEAGDITFCYLSNSCPEVNRMIMQRTEPIGTLYDDSNDKSNDEVRECAGFDSGRFYDAIKSFNVGMHIFTNRDIPLSGRLFLILFYVEKFQKLMNAGNDVSNLIGVFLNHEIYTLFLENLTAFEINFEDRINLFKIIYKTLMDDSYEHSMWARCKDFGKALEGKDLLNETLRNSFYNYERSDVEVEYEQLITYRFFAVFMQGFENTDYFDKLAYEIIMIAALKTYDALFTIFYGHTCTQEDRILFYSLCGRINHTTKKKEKLINELRQGGFYEMDKLIRLVY